MRLFSLLFLTMCLNNSFGQNQVIFKGSKFDMSPATKAEVQDPVSNKIDTQIIPATPLRINGEPIHDIHGLTKLPAYTDAKEKPTKLAAFIFNTLKEALQKLDDGEYILLISNPVIDKNGYLAYFEFSGIQKLIPHPVSTIEQPDEAVNNIKKSPAKYTRIEKIPNDKNIPVTIKKTINTKTQYLLGHMPKMNPGEINGAPVNCKGALFNSGSLIIVKNHNAVFSPQYFCL
jgi:hypothetical protein